MKLTIIACHPVSYQLPLFCSIESKLNSYSIITSTVFLDNFSLSKTYFSDIDGILDIEPQEYLSKLSHQFSRNHSKGIKSGYFSRVNFDILKQISNSDYVLLHGYEYFSYFIVLFLCILLQKRVIFRGEATLRDNSAEHQSSKPFARLREIFKSLYVQLFLENSTLVLYSCHGNMLYFQKYIGVKSNKLRYFPCSVDNSLCKSLASAELRTSLRSKFNICNSSLVIGFSGRLTPRKNLDFLLNSINFLGDDLKSIIHVVFVGGGPEASNLSNKARFLNIKLTITSFLPHKSSLSCLNVFDVFCIPSLYDPSPKSLNEAMNFALPILVSDRCGTAQDLVFDHVNGHTFSPYLVQDLAQKLVQICSLSPHKLRDYGNASAEIVLRFSCDAAAELLATYLADRKI